jgi:hypothetical protein
MKRTPLPVKEEEMVLTPLSSRNGGAIMCGMVVKSSEQSRDALRGAQEALREAEHRLEELHASLGEQRADEDGLTVRELAERVNVSEEAVRAFAETAGELLGGAPLSAADARRGAMLATAGAAWERELGPLLSVAQVRELLGGVSRQRVDELLRAKRLIGVRERSGRRRYPLFQFHDGRPVESLAAAFHTVVDAGLDEWSAASWSVRPDPALDGESAVQWAKAGKDPERLARVARQDARRFSQ